MRRLANILAATAAAGAVMASAWPGSGEASAEPLFVSPQHDFRIAFPNPPEIEGRGAKTDDASGYRTYSARGRQGAFLVRVDQYPKTIPVPAPDPQVYELILRAYAAQSASRLETTTPVQLDGHAALQGLFAHAEGTTEIRRVLMVGRRIYQLSYTGADRAAADETAAAFLDSFRIEATE